ncbi:MAG: RNA methyltransferase [Pleurocapsa sp.]
MNYNLLDRIKIVLVEPAGGLNVGSIARVMKNMGLSNLVLVNPQCDLTGDDARKMAVHAVEVLEQAAIFDSLPDALTGCQLAIATTARSRSLPTQFESPRQGVKYLLQPQINSALIFGPEDRGLSNSELKYAQKFIYIDSNPAYPSLNLAQAVAICTYEIYQASIDNSETYDTPQKSQASNSGDYLAEYSPFTLNFGSISVNNAPLEVLEAYYQHLETVLLEIGYLYPHTAIARMDKLRRIYNRANLNREEVAMLRGILRQMQWFNSQKCSSDSKQ